jgi:hypothetical protein
MHRFHLQDWQWALVQDLFPSNEGKQGEPWREHRTVLNGMGGLLRVRARRIRGRPDRLELRHVPSAGAGAVE